MMATKHTIGRLIIVGLSLALIVSLLRVGLPKLAQLQTTNNQVEVTTTLNASTSENQAVRVPPSQSSINTQAAMTVTTSVVPDVQLPSSPANESQTSTNEESGLRLNLATNKQRYVLGEPISLTLTIQNVQDSPKSLHMLLEPHYGVVWTQIRYENDEYENYSGPGFGTADYILGKPSSLAPGKQLVERRKILYEPLEDDPKKFYALSRAGNYSLRMVLDNIVPNQRLTTTAVQIEVVEPTGLDKQVWRLLQTEEAASFLHNGYVSNPKQVIANFNAILVQYPNSFYASYLQMALNVSHSQHNKAETEIQTANVNSLPAIRMVNDQLYFVRSTTDDDIRAANNVDEQTLNQIIDMIHMLVDAWNNRDFDSYVQLYSRQTKTWQDWQTGSESLTYLKLNEGVQSLFSSTGTITVEIIGFTIGTDDIIVDVIPHFTGKQFVFNGMRFVQDEDGVWRLASLE